jgi:hypothetical protein
MKFPCAATMQGRGGSLFMHRHVKPGMEMVLSHPVNLFPLDNRARKHLMIAGGIGITPFLARSRQLTRFGGKFELHYAARNPALAAYMDRLKSAYGDKVHLYFDDLGQAIDLAASWPASPLARIFILRAQGDAELGAQDRRNGAGPPAVHFEEFLAPGTGALRPWSWPPRARPSPSAPPSRCLRRWRPPASMRPTCAGAGPAGNAKPMSSAAMAPSTPRPLADPRRTGRRAEDHALRQPLRGQDAGDRPIGAGP